SDPPAICAPSPEIPPAEMKKQPPMTIDREAFDLIYRHNFAAFSYRAFDVLNPGQELIDNWHIDAMCYAIEQVLKGGPHPRLVLTLPPRSLKSMVASVCLPAWMLGRNPAARILCASYSEDLAHKFSRDCRALMGSPCYKRVFPRTRLHPKKNTDAESE